LRHLVKFDGLKLGVACTALVRPQFSLIFQATSLKVFLYGQKSGVDISHYDDDFHGSNGNYQLRWLIGCKSA
jgi:hypothetical protein